MQTCLFASLLCLFPMKCISASVMLSAVALALLIDLSCAFVASAALQRSTALCKGMSPSLSSVPRVLSHAMPHTIRSRIRLSCSSPNSHERALILRSVTYWSIDSPVC